MHTVTHGGNVTNRLSTTDELAAMRARHDEEVGDLACEMFAEIAGFEYTEDHAGSRQWDEALDMVRKNHQDLPRLLDAVEAVLALHQPHGRYTDSCYECGLANPEDGSGQPYPCPTRRAITSALGASE